MKKEEGERQGVGNRAREVSRGIGSLTVQNLATGFMSFAFLVALLRLLSPVEYGSYSAVLIATTIASTVSTFGLQAAAARYVALLRQTRDEKGAYAAASSVIRLAIILSLSATAVFALISPALSEYFVRDTSLTSVFLLGSLWLFSNSLSLVLQGAVQGFKRYILLAKMLFVSRAMMVAFTVAGLILYRDVTVAITAWILYGAILVLWSLKAIGFGTLRGPRRFSYKEIMKYSFPLGAAGIALNFAAYADSIVVGGYEGLRLLGTYSAAVQISGIMTVVLLIPLTTAFLPEIASISHEPAYVSNGLRLGLRFVALAVLPASFIVGALSAQLITLFTGGDGYLAGAESLELIALTYVFYAAMTVMYYLLQAIGKTVQAMVIGGASAAADVALSLVLVPNFGLFGAAMSKVLVSLIGMLIAIYFARNYLQTLDRLGFYARGVLGSAISFSIVYLLSTFVSSRTATLLPYFLIGGFVFVLCVRAFGLLNDEDKAYLSHIIPGRFQWILRYV